MKVSVYLVALIALFPLFIHAQIKLEILGKVGGKIEALPNAGVFLNGKLLGIADEQGRFLVKSSNFGDTVTATFAGYQSANFIVGSAKIGQIILNPMLIQEVDVIEVQEAIKLSTKSLSLEYQINRKELRRAACCNLSESFENNPSIDVAFADAITGTKTIEMLGLSGKYIQTQIELIPFLRGIQVKRGWAYIPGTWVNSLQLTKGIGSVANGHESMSGQLNIELIKPMRDSGTVVNVYFNQTGRSEFNVTNVYPLNPNWSTATLIHASGSTPEIDRNNDGFLDMSAGHLYSVLNRWQWLGKNGWEGQFGGRWVEDFQSGGQLSNTEIPNPWRLRRDSRGGNFFAKLGLIWPSKPNNSLGFIANVNYQEMFANYGSRYVNAFQNGANVQAIFDYLSQKGGGVKVGAQIYYDQYRLLANPQYQDLAGDQLEINRALFAEYNWQPNERFNLLMGLRQDFHNLFGSRLSPRLHLRYAILPQTILRASTGSGFRSPQAWLENTELLASARQINLNQLLPFFHYRPNAEEAWNHGFSVQHQFKWNYRPATLVLDYFYTYFNNRQIVDMDVNSYEFQIFSREKQSFSHSAMVQLDYELKRRMSLRVAYKFTNAITDFSISRLQDSFVSKHRGFIAWFYETRNQWGFDLSLNWQGPKRLPINDRGDNQNTSPSFALINTQIKKQWAKKLETYIGVENLLNFMQPNPIINPSHPFEQGFDATQIWGPIMGAIIFVGCNYQF